MRVSVVIDNYNHEQYLADAIDSALAQTWPDTEVLVVDDGSTDGSRAIIEYYGTRIRPLLKTNGGQGSALSTGLIACSGDAVIFLDSDGTLEPDTVSRVAHAFIDDPATARVQWPLQNIDSNGHPDGQVVPDPSTMRSGDLRSHVLRYRTYVRPTMSGNAYNVDVLRRLLPVPDEFRHSGCEWYLAETTPLLGPVKSLQEVGGGHRAGNVRNQQSDRDPESLREQIRLTTDGHSYVRKICADLGVECPDDYREPLDVAFIARRLALLRLDPQNRAIPSDRVDSLTARGLSAAIRHPHHKTGQKLKDVAWFLGIGLSPRPVARRLINRLNFVPYRVA